MRLWFSARLARGLGLVVLAVSVLVGPAAGGVSSASRSAGQIAFVRDDGIYVMRSDGSGIHALRKGPAWFSTALAWSPDGLRLAFATHRALWVMNADGSDPVRLTPPVRGRFGAHVGWMSPSWLPDGSRIAYTFSRSANADRDVWVMNADGSGKRRLSTTPDCSEVNVDWSPAGGRLVTTCVFGWGTRDLIVTNLAGGARRTLRATAPPTGAASPDWSPDGRRIAFAEFLSRGARIAVVDAATGSVRRLVEEGLNTNPSWSPDGTRIAFDRLGKDAGIYVVDAAGGRLGKLTANGRFPAWQPARPHR